MRGRLCFAAIAATLLAVFASISLAGAESMEWKGRTVYHMTKVEAIPVGDVPGHVIGIADARGLTFIDNGEVATYLSRICFDFTNGNGPHWAYGVTTYEDGSTTVVKAEGTTTALPGGASTFEGTLSYIKGTGRFEGIQGGGTYTGKRVAPLAPGGPADSYSDWSATYTLPSR
jgi:hypothetical protein